jgi:hypothetical protein
MQSSLDLAIKEWRTTPFQTPLCALSPRSRWLTQSASSPVDGHWTATATATLQSKTGSGRDGSARHAQTSRSRVARWVKDNLTYDTKVAEPKKELCRAGGGHLRIPAALVTIVMGIRGQVVHDTSHLERLRQTNWLQPPLSACARAHIGIPAPVSLLYVPVLLYCLNPKT